MRDTLQALNHFGSTVVDKSKSNLKEEGKKSSGKLINSIGYKAKVSKNSFELSFQMEDYWTFVDYGVKGKGGVRKTTSKFKRTNNKGKLWKLKKVTNNKYKFGKSGGISPKHFTGWAKRKGLSPFAVAKSVFHTGIETTSFFTKPFEKEFKKLPDELVKAYALDVEELLKFSIQ